MRLAVAILCALTSCTESEPVTPRAPRPVAPAPPLPPAIPKGWRQVEFAHFSFIVPDDWTRIPAKNGEPVLFVSEDAESGIIGGTLESDTRTREELAREMVSGGNEWGDTVDGLPATYISGTPRAENKANLYVTAVVFQDGTARHWLQCKHFNANKMTETCRRVFASLRLRR